MPEARAKIYEFDGFRLNITEHLLLRETGERVVLTAKAFETLCVLVKKSGHLVHKDDLIDQIWADAIVEENNLNKCIHAVRRSLGEKKGGPLYIETVKKHGFRFTPEVRIVSEKQIVAPETSDAGGSGRPVPRRNGSTKYFRPIMVGSILIGLLLLIGGWLTKNARSNPAIPILSASYASEGISSTGRIHDAAISPDGNRAVFTSVGSNNKQSVWLRNLETGSDVAIIPADDYIYFGVGFSPDGRDVYFVRRPRVASGVGTSGLFRMSVLGGPLQKIIETLEGSFSISPDGSQVSFVRCAGADDDYCSLWIADSGDGGNQKKLLSRSRPFRITAMDFSPDGKLLAYATGQSENAANEFGLMTIDLATNETRDLTTEKFFYIGGVQWLPDQSGTLITAFRRPNKNGRIWHVSARTGHTQPLSPETISYSELSLDKSASKLITTMVKEEFFLSLSRFGESSEPQVLARATSVSFGPDGTIYFTSSQSGNDDIWSISPAGENELQLTDNPADDRLPIISADNRTIFFVSNRSGAAQIWRMSIDGSEPIQLTRSGGWPRAISPDGEWLYFVHGTEKTLWAVSTSTDDEKEILAVRKSWAAFSPDTSNVAYAEYIDGIKYLCVFSRSDGKLVRKFKMQDQIGVFRGAAWLPDGSGVAYVLVNNELRDNAVWLQRFDEEETLTKVAEYNDVKLTERSFAISPDGATFAIVKGNWKSDAVLVTGLKADQ